MASTLKYAIAPDSVVSFEIKPGSLLQLLETRAEGGPRLKCFDGTVTLVSPGMSHETTNERLATLVLAICLEFRIKHTALASTTWALPLGAEDTAYEADKAYYIQSHSRAEPGQPPDLAIEIVVSHSARKAILAGAFLKIPELWVLDIPRHKLTFITWRVAANTRRPIGPIRQVELFRGYFHRSAGSIRGSRARCHRLPRKLPVLG